MRTLGIIPARGGSKGIPRKNLRPVGGKPLVVRATEVASNSTLLTHFLVSTDDAEIAQVARKQGCAVLLRPPELAADDTPMVPVVQHVLDSLASDEAPFDAVAVLQPTSPFRTHEDIDAAIDLLAKTGRDSVISVYLVEDAHPSRMYRFMEDRLVPCDTEPPSSLRQELSEVYHRNGAIYACRCSYFLTHQRLVSPDCYPYVMPRERSLNVDTELDLRIADCLLRESRSR